MEGHFTVEEAAGIMLCDRATVYRLLAEGWLRRPEGKTKKETGGRVTKKSLYQVMVVDRLSLLPVKVLKKIRASCKYFEKSESQMAEAKCLSIDEGRHKRGLRALAPLQNTKSDSGL